MGFFDALLRVRSRDRHPHETDETRKSLRAAWGLADVESPKAPALAQAGQLPTAGAATGSIASEYDRSQWRKKLRHVLEELPASQPRWRVLEADAHALNLDPQWIADRKREEFAFLVRRAVADRTLSADAEEHHKLELARRLIGMPETEAEAILHAITAEAEAFFGSPSSGQEPPGG
jgi:hypothetical protein